MAEVARIYNSTLDAYAPIMTPKELAKWRVDGRWMEKNFPIRDFYIAKDPYTKENVGMISLQFFPQADLGYLGYVFVDKSFLGEGVGKKMISFAEGEFAKRGLSKMALISHPRAGKVIESYEKCGFKKSMESEPTRQFEGVLEPFYDENYVLLVKDIERGFY